MKNMTVPEFLAQSDAVRHEQLVIDVRELDEWEDGFIPTAHHIPLGELAHVVEKKFPNKQADIVVYCASGGRSRRAVQAMELLGYTHAKNLDGGYFVYQMYTR